MPVPTAVNLANVLVQCFCAMFSPQSAIRLPVYTKYIMYMIGDNREVTAKETHLVENVHLSLKISLLSFYLRISRNGAVIASRHVYTTSLKYKLYMDSCLTLSSMNLPWSSSSTTSRELLSQF